MSKAEQMEAELRKLSQAELRQVRAWLDDVIEDELEFSPDFERAIQQSEQDMSESRSARARRLVSAATQIYYDSSDAVFLKLAPALRSRVEAEIDRIGSRLSTYPHHRLKGSSRFRARLGDYPDHLQLRGGAECN